MDRVSMRLKYGPVGAAEGCDLLILLLKTKIKRSQPAAAPTEVGAILGVSLVGDKPGFL
ncbi:hypothetical protein JFU37_08035 [Pseudomonas sp. TH41]|uniref:hypothetical protein n=1 Tax=Pseudomonas sp. TH41 TaxID=2796405 RepID=UPI0019120E6B|nr:hypothetical protein [Pseudomonas sp. TH41]MBK5352455.1 hypothetical protein [Pseudomonas sp. TH41]